MVKFQVWQNSPGQNMLVDPEDFFHVLKQVNLMLARVTILNFMFEFMEQFGETA